MDDPSDPVVEPANLRFLRRLVTVLTATMIGGLFIIIALFVIRFSDRSLPLPAEITLPDGAKADAFTQGRGWYAVVTDQDQILIFDKSSGTLRQTIEIQQNN